MPVAQESNALRHEEAKPGRRTVRVGSHFLVQSVAPGLKPPSLPRRFLEQFEDLGAAYHIEGALQLEGDLNEVALQRTLDRMNSKNF